MGIWAMLVPWVWVWPGLAPDPVFFHAHELIFGMAAAALGGYLLTALPSWTAPRTTSRTGHRTGLSALALLVLAWGLGRGAMIVGAQGPIVLFGASLFPLGLAALVLPPVLRAGAWQKLPLAIAPLVLAIADLAWLAGRGTGASDQTSGLALVLGFALMISMVGGRALPAFVNSRLAASGVRVLPHHGPGLLACGLILLALVLVVAGGPPAMSGGALLAAGALQSGRFVAWRARGLTAHKDLLLLYIAWAWLALGLQLTGFAMLTPQVLSVATALHALSIGAMGSMILAISARAFMARAPGMLRASAFHLTALALIGLAAVLRLVFPYVDVAGYAGLQWSAASWSLGWALYLVPLLRNLARPSPYPVLSADRSPDLTRP
tara:strand:- start:3105 stop:4241 length:1137 start_codon:yes stop_codon:yes gene_type:complete